MNCNTKQTVIERDGERCLRCGSPNELTIDHIVPRSRLNNNITDERRLSRFHARSVRRALCNFQTLCGPCNRLKSNGPAVDYRDSVSLRSKLLHLMSEFGIYEEVIEGTPLYMMA